MRNAGSGSGRARGRSAVETCVEPLEGRRLLSTSSWPTVPATDPRGAPDLIVDARALNDWRVTQETFAADHPAVVEGMVTEGTHRLLRFTSSTPNIGQGDLIIGNPADHPEWFDLAPTHGHYHMKEYADYRLWTPDGYEAWVGLRQANPDTFSAELLESNPGLASEMVSGHKQGFCAIDVKKYSKDAGSRKYDDCFGNQGVSVGWSDVYERNLDGQWVVVTGVTPGDYVLEVEVNAERFFEESNYANNTASIPVTISPPKKGSAGTTNIATTEVLTPKATIAKQEATFSVKSILGTEKDLLG